MSGNGSFLPEDYVKRKAENRTNLLSLVLFAVVMLAVFGAFMFTNQRWSEVKDRQEQINVQYRAAALDITELQELEQQKEEMLGRAELAAALVERVPRSILLAELINRMPGRMTIQRFELESKRLATISRPNIPQTAGGGKRLAPKSAPTLADAATGAVTVSAPRFEVNVSIVGFAQSNREIARYLEELGRYPLLERVRLDYIEEKEQDGRMVHEFRVEMQVDPDADARDIEPISPPRPIDDAATEILPDTADAG